MLGFLYWDINREIVTLPVVHLPLTWYGLLFALGFYIALCFFIILFTRFLLSEPSFLSEDVDWKALEKTMPSQLKGIKKNDAAACSRLLEKPLSNDIFNKPLSQKGERLVRVAAKNFGDEAAEKIRKRLLLEEKFPRVFFSIHARAKLFSERLLLYVLVGAVVGARLFHVLFYEEPLEYLLNPLSILKTWEGGLASHGGVIAILIAIALFYRKVKASYPRLLLLRLVDYIAIPTMIAAFFIRIGNFCNQEILGIASSVPWAIIFGHPADGSSVLPRHPAQLYEAAFYLGLFCFLFMVWKTKERRLAPGRFAGIAIMGSFLFRFFIEFIKTGQSVWFDTNNALLVMGQLLSLPLILVGAFLIFRKERGTARG